jgi:hypothetical protein
LPVNDQMVDQPRRGVVEKVPVIDEQAPVPQNLGRPAQRAVVGERPDEPVPARGLR